MNVGGHTRKTGMKIRNGFVSNSSTTSFCVMGICGENKDNHLCSGNLLVSYGYPCGDTLYVGVPIEKMEEDETLGQFRERVKQIFLAKDMDCEPQLLTDGWYDG